jgi:cytochrome P450
LAVNGYNYDKTPRMTGPRGKRLSGEGLLTSSGTIHVEQRNLMRPIFCRKVIDEFAGLIVRNTERMVAGWANGAEVDVSQNMMDLAQRNIIQILLGADFDDNLEQLVEAISIRRRYMHHVFFSPVPEWLPSPIGFAYRRATPQLDRILYRAIEQRRSIPSTDLLSSLVHARYDDGRSISDAQVHDEARMLLITGYETVGEALAWTAYLLARHPDIYGKLCAEVADRLGGRVPGANDLAKLDYTANVWAESLRLYPPHLDYGSRGSRR